MSLSETHHQEAPEVVRERIVAKDRAVLARLMECHPERAKNPPRPVVVIAAPESPPIIIEPMPKLPSVIVEPEPETTRPLMIQEIMKATAKYFQISHRDIICARRNKRIVIPRQIAMYLCRELTLKSLPEIGRCLGGKDHTTIMHGARKITFLRTIDPELNSHVLAVAKTLGAELS